MSANQRNVDSLKATKSGFKLGKVSLRKKGQSLPTLISFYQNQQVNYTDSYGKLYGVVYNSIQEDSNQIGTGEIVFKGNRFFWDALLFKNDGSEAYAEGTFVYEVDKNELQLQIEQKSPLYEGGMYSNDNKRFEYNSLGKSPFIATDVTMQVKPVGNELSMTSKTPDLNVYSAWSHDASLYGKLTSQTVAGIEKLANKTKNVTDVFSNANAFEEYVENTLSNNDGVSQFTANTGETISTIDGDGNTEEIKTVYSVNYVYDNGDPALGGKGERIAVTSDGRVYWGYQDGESSIDADKTAEVQAKLN